MRSSIGFLTLTLLTLATAGHAGEASTLDLTGTWTGKGSCSGLVAGSKVSSPADVSVEITHDTGTDQIAFTSSFAGTSSVPLTVAFEGCGFAEAESAKPDRGRAAIHGFDETIPFDAFGTADLSKVSVFAPDGKGRTGKMKGVVFLGVRDAGDAIVTCKLNVSRVSQVDPELPSCLTMALTAD